MKLDSIGADRKGAAPARAGTADGLREDAHGMKPDIRRMLSTTRAGAPMEKTIGEIVRMGNDPSLREQVISQLRLELRVGNRHAAVALGGLRAKEAVRDLAEAALDHGKNIDYLLRRNSLVALGEIGEEAAGALPEILLALQQRDVQHWAAKALTQMGKTGLDALIDALDNRTTELAAVQALGDMGKKAECALPKLRKKTGWLVFDRELKKAAHEAIEKIERAADHIEPVTC